MLMLIKIELNYIYHVLSFDLLMTKTGHFGLYLSFTEVVLNIDGL
jgi:hypothetical protein